MIKKIVFNELWFEESLPIADKSSKILFLRNLYSPISLKQINFERKGLTLITDLSRELEIIKGEISQKTRNYINRCLKDNRIIVKYYNSYDKKIIKGFISTFNGNYKEKNLKYRMRKYKIMPYIKSSRFLISVTFVDNIPVIYHTYVLGKTSCRFLHSASVMRNLEGSSFTSNDIASYNRFAHYKDLEYFKNNNFLVYDWGGISSFDNPNGIDKFKLYFGGVKTATYNYWIVFSKLQWFLFKLLKR